MPHRLTSMFFEHRLIFLLSALFAFCSSGVIGFPIWFQQSSFQCFISNKWEECGENKICGESMIFQLNPLNTIKTLATDLNLVCERKAIYRFIISGMFLGGFLGCLFNIIFSIPTQYRLKALGILGLVFGIAKLTIIFFYHYVYILAFALFTISFCCMSINSYCFAAVNEIFPAKIAKVYSVALTLSWGTFGVVFSIFSYLVNSNWQIVMLMPAIPVLIVSVGLLLVDIKKYENIKAPNNIIEFVKDINPKKVLRNNFIIFVLIWTVTSITYNDILLELHSVGNSLYFNMGFIAFVEILASYLAGYVGIVLNPLKSIRILIILSAGLFLSFFSAPAVSSKSTFFLCMLLIAKFLSETVAYLINIYAPRMISERFSAFFFIFSRLSSRFFLLLLPHINHSFRSYGLHPFCFLVFLWLGSLGLTLKTKERSEESNKGYSAVDRNEDNIEKY